MLSTRTLRLGVPPSHPVNRPEPRAWESELLLRVRDTVQH